MRRKKTINTKIAALALSAVFGGVILVAYETTKVLVKTALDRDKPKFMENAGNRISGGQKDEKFREECEKASKKLSETEHKEVKIITKDRVGLTGHFFPCENQKRVIIAFHGWRSSWSYDYGMISEFWQNNGCSVLYAEQRGQNNSGGEHMGFGLTERYDCLEWIKWITENLGEDVPIYLAGISMGAATVLMASSLMLPKNVCGIMADCGFTSPKEIWKHVARKNLHMAYGIRGILADAICRRKISMGSGDYSTVEALKNTNVPVLFIHGSDDKFVPVEMTFENYKACASPKRLLIVCGADHAMSYYVNKDEYEKSVLEFWQSFDSLCLDKNNNPE